MRIIATLTKGKDLKPGDLFSSRGKEYWQHDRIILNEGAVGERVYIRTETPTPEYEADVDIYKITIEL